MTTLTMIDDGHAVWTLANKLRAAARSTLGQHWPVKPHWYCYGYAGLSGRTWGTLVAGVAVWEAVTWIVRHGHIAVWVS